MIWFNGRPPKPYGRGQGYHRACGGVGPNPCCCRCRRPISALHRLHWKNPTLETQEKHFGCAHDRCFLFPSTWAAPHMQCIIWDRKGNCSSCPKRATSESRAAAGLPFVVFPTQSSVERDGAPALQIPPPSPLFHTSIDRWVDRSRSWFGVVWAEAGRSLLCGLLGSLASVSSAIDTPAPSRLR